MPLGVIALTTVAVIAISIYCLLSGWVIIFQNLFYIPIIIACVYYAKKGFVFSLVLSLVYFLLIIAFTRNSSVIIQALIRVVIFAGIAGVITHLSMRKQAEKTLSSAALYARSLIEASLDPLVTISPKGKITDVNEATIKVTGVSRDKLIGTDFSNYFTEPNKAREGYQQVLAKGSVTDYPLTIRDNDGKLIEVIYNASVYKDVNGRAIGVFAAARDITERKRAEDELKKNRYHLEELVKERTAELRKSEEKFRTMADFTYDWEYWLDTDRRMLYVSPSCERITGFPPDSFYKNLQFINTIIYPDDRQSFENHVGSYHVGNKHDESDEMEFRIVDRNGDTKWIAHVCAPITGDNGAYLGRRVSNRDITERKFAEEELKRRSVELEAANRELESFAYSVSHDLRAPLRTIDGFSQIIIDDYAGKLDEQGRNYLLRVKTATQRMGQLIDDMLKLSRITRQELKREDVDLSMMARKISAELSTSHPERQVEFAIKPGCVENCDRQLIGIALENLIANSWKYSSRHTSAKIEFDKMEKDGKTVYFVRDDGAGFDPAYADKLFAPFQRLHAASEFEGNGIGLATIQRIVRKHGGSVWAEGQVEKGATVYFTLT